jgi:ATP-dependent DNA ligase
VAFDLIELNGDDLRREPFVVRKATLASLLGDEIVTGLLGSAIPRFEHLKAFSRIMNGLRAGA